MIADLLSGELLGRDYHDCRPYHTAQEDGTQEKTTHFKIFHIHLLSTKRIFAKEIIIVSLVFVY